MEKISRRLSYICRNLYYLWILYYLWVEWMNGICLIWSRGRLISPSLPVGDDRYLNLSSQKRPTGRNLREIVATTTLWHHVQKYCCLGVSFAHAQVPSNSSSYHILGNEVERKQRRTGLSFRGLFLCFVLSILTCIRNPCRFSSN